MLFLPSLKDNITRLEVDEEGVRKGGKGEREQEKRGREGKKDGWVRSLHLWQRPGYWCVWDLAICSVFFDPSPFSLSVSIFRAEFPVLKIVTRTVKAV